MANQIKPLVANFLTPSLPKMVLLNSLYNKFLSSSIIYKNMARYILRTYILGTLCPNLSPVPGINGKSSKRKKPF